MHSPPAPVLRRGLLALVVGACLAIPLAALSVGHVVLVYLADFNDAPISPPQDSEQIFMALGGDAVMQGPAAVFEVEFDHLNNGVAVANGNPTLEPAQLSCRLVPPFQGTNATITMDLTRSLDPGDILFRVEDDNDIGVIDVVMDDEGDMIIVVGPVATPLGVSPTLLGEELELELELLGDTGGGGSWNLNLTGGGQSYSASGDLDLAGLVSISELRFVRPALEPCESDRIDNVSVTTVSQHETSQGGQLRK